MKKEEMKMKVKKFAEEHKKGLTFVVGTGLVITGACVGWNTCLKSNGLNKYSMVVMDKDIIRTFMSAKDSYPGGVNLVTGKVDAPLMMSDLGALGEEMMKRGCVDASGLTHFVMFGDIKGLTK